MSCDATHNVNFAAMLQAIGARSALRFKPNRSEIMLTNNAGLQQTFESVGAFCGLGPVSKQIQQSAKA